MRLLLNATYIIFLYRGKLLLYLCSITYLPFLQGQKWKDHHDNKLCRLVAFYVTITTRNDWKLKDFHELIGRIRNLSRTRIGFLKSRLSFSLKLSRTNFTRPKKQPFSIFCRPQPLFTKITSRFHANKFRQSLKLFNQKPTRKILRAGLWLVNFNNS